MSLVARRVREARPYKSKGFPQYPRTQLPDVVVFQPMTIQTRKISVDDANSILQRREDHFNDMKSKLIGVPKLSKSLSAFANADGGELFIGISENDGTFSWEGYGDEEDANGHIQALQDSFPLGEGIAYEFIECPEMNGLILHIEILKSTSIVKSSDGKVYLRRGAQSLPQDSPEKIKRLERDKGITSYETELVNIDSSDIIESEITTSFLKSQFPETSAEQWLKKQRVILGGRPTVAGILLFSDLPQAILPKTSVKLYRYRTTDSEGTRDSLDGVPKTIEGPLLEQVKQSVKQTTQMVESIKKMGDGGFVAVSYPPETLHEIITNAIIHRNYGTSDDVHIRIFDNRVEVESPGQLAGHITENNILEERFSRNGVVVRLINKFPDPPNKDVGEGLTTAFRAMKKLQLKDPVITEKRHSVLVNIRHEKLASPEEAIMEYLKTHDQIANRDVRKITGIGSENAVKNIFNKMMRANQIRRVPGKRGSLSCYELATKN